MKNNRTFKSLPTYGEIESGLFHKTDVIKSVCVRHTYEEKHKDIIAVKVCKKCGHVK